MGGGYADVDQLWRQSYLSRLPRPKSITGLALAIGALMLVNLSLSGLLIERISDRADLLTSIRNGAQVTVAQAGAADHRVRLLAGWFIACFIATGILVMIWTYRARWNVDNLSEYDPIRSSGWAIWGWICPIVALWFPYQVVRDILRAQRAAFTGDLEQRRHDWLVIAWWVFIPLSDAAQLGTQTINTNDAADQNDFISKFVSQAHWQITCFSLTIAAGLAFLAVVARVTIGNRELSTRPLAAPPRPPWFTYNPPGYAPPPIPQETAWPGLSSPAAYPPPNPPPSGGVPVD